MSVLPLPEACPARAGAQRCEGTRRRVPPHLPARIAPRYPALTRTQVCPAVYTPLNRSTRSPLVLSMPLVSVPDYSLRSYLIHQKRVNEHVSRDWPPSPTPIRPSLRPRARLRRVICVSPRCSPRRAPGRGAPPGPLVPPHARRPPLPAPPGASPRGSSLPLPPCSPHRRPRNRSKG